MFNEFREFIWSLAAAQVRALACQMGYAQWATAPVDRLRQAMLTEEGEQTFEFWRGIYG